VSDVGERFTQLRPWDNVTEEDLYGVEDLYLSIRGQLHGSPEVWVTNQYANARAWVMEPEKGAAPEDWVFHPATGVTSTAGGKQVDSAQQLRVERAVKLVLDHFEGRKPPDVTFPIWMNPDLQ
jgi:hypothetical protein